MSEPMDVRRVYSDDGLSSWPDPPLDDAWSDLDRLRWKAGLATSDAGLQVTVNEADSCRWMRLPGRVLAKGWRPEVGKYDVRADGMVSGPMSYHDAWSWLSGFTAGATAERRWQEVATR